MPKRNHKNNDAGQKLFGRKIASSSFRKFITAALTTLIVFLLLLWRLQPQQVSLRPGDTAVQTITANRAAVYVDVEETERLRQEAANSISPVYSRDANATAVAERTVFDIFAAAQTVRNDEALATALDKVDRLRDQLDVSLSPQTLRLLVKMQEGAFERRKASIVEIVREQMVGEIRSNTDDLKNAREKAAAAADKLDISTQFKQMEAELAKVALCNNLIYDGQATEEKRQQAARQVEEQRRQLQPGDILISPGETVTRRHLAMFEALGLVQPTIDYTQALALLLLVISLTLSIVIYLFRFAPQVHRDERLFYTLCASIVLAVLIIRLLEGSPYYLIWALTTATTLAMFLSVVISSEVAVAAVIFIAIVVGSMTAGGDTRLLITTAICGMAAAYAVPTGHTRTTMVTRASLLTAFINPAVLGISSKVLGMNIAYEQLGVAAAAGLASAILAFGLVMVIQRPLRLITEMRLIELLNPNEALLKELLTEAPGSYQSSVMVANLAEPAAEAIGANGLLTRTCCMYHDIGKLKRPLFFGENQFGTENPHDHLSPHLSALVLISHVKEGMELAEDAGLPAEIAAVIPEHHGTSLVSYLYRKAAAEAEDPDEVREADFRYDGPRPQSRETAIVMLADTVEAAARTMEDPQPQRIEELVDRLVDAKIEDGQLDEAPLTFHDITTIKASFIHTLNRMFHHRTRYPDNFLPENMRGLTGPKPDENSASEGENSSSGSPD